LIVFMNRPFFASTRDNALEWSNRWTILPMFCTILPIPGSPRYALTYNGLLSTRGSVVPQELPEDLQTALFDLQRYLLDQIPPITAWDSIEMLMQQPPELFMRQVHAWVVEQGRLQPAPVSDFLFHALKKVFMVGELKLIDRAVMLSFLDRVQPVALQ